MKFVKHIHYHFLTRRNVKALNIKPCINTFVLFSTFIFCRNVLHVNCKFKVLVVEQYEDV